MPEHFCTYFDHRYAAKGLTMWRSLKAQRPDARLHVLCLDPACEALMRALELEDVELYSLATLEQDDRELLSTKGTRSRLEYYFTITPCFPRFLLHRGLVTTRLTYVDADLFFLADPQPAFDEMDGASVGIIEHRFAPALADRVVYGRFNVGWLTFRDDAMGLACLDAWRVDCLAWCYDRLEGDRFADQKYLDHWPERFAGVRVIDHPGANLAPWNLARHVVTKSAGQALSDGRPVLFFHAHGFEPAGASQGRQMNLSVYDASSSKILERTIFGPYERALTDAVGTIAVPLVLDMNRGRTRETPWETEALREYRSARSYADLLEQQLAACADQQRSLSAALETSRAETVAERAASQTTVGMLRTDVSDREGTVAALRTDLLASARQIGALTEAVESEKQRREVEQTAAEGLRGALEREQTALAALAAEHAGTHAALAAERGLLATERAHLSEREATIAALRNDLLDSASKVGALTEAVESEKQRREIERTAAEGLRRALEHEQAVHESLAAEHAGTEATLAQVESRLAASEAGHDELRASLARSKADAAALSAALERERTAAAAELETAQLAAAQALEKARADASARVEQERTAAAAEKADLQAALAASRSESEVRTRLLSELQATMAAMASSLEAAGERVGALTAQINREERARMDTRRDLDAVRAQLSTTQADADTLRRDLSATQAELAMRERELRGTIERLTRDIDTLTAQRDEARTNWYHADGNLKVLKASLSWKVTGPLRVVRDALVGPAKHD